MTAANIPTPPAYFFTDDGLNIQQGGEVVAVIAQSYYGNLTKDLIARMVGDLSDKPR